MRHHIAAEISGHIRCFLVLFLLAARAGLLIRLFLLLLLPHPARSYTLHLKPTRRRRGTCHGSSDGVGNYHMTSRVTTSPKHVSVMLCMWAAAPVWPSCC